MWIVRNNQGELVAFTNKPKLVYNNIWVAEGLDNVIFPITNKELLEQYRDLKNTDAAIEISSIDELTSNTNETSLANKFEKLLNSGKYKRTLDITLNHVINSDKCVYQVIRSIYRYTLSTGGNVFHEAFDETLEGAIDILLADIANGIDENMDSAVEADKKIKKNKKLKKMNKNANKSVS